MSGLDGTCGTDGVLPGEDGKPGHHGGNAGSFYCQTSNIGQALNQLKVNLNGGQGGNGVKGKDGLDGKDGDSDIETGNKKNPQDNIEDQYYYNDQGTDGEPGQNGGKGGSAGSGGFQGLIKVEGFQWDYPEAKNGSNGKNGEAKEGGKGGKHGKHCSRTKFTKVAKQEQFIKNGKGGFLGLEDRPYVAERTVYTGERTETHEDHKKDRGNAPNGQTSDENDLNNEGQPLQIISNPLNSGPFVYEFKKSYIERKKDTVICPFMRDFLNLNLDQVGSLPIPYGLLNLPMMLPPQNNLQEVPVPENPANNQPRNGIQILPPNVVGELRMQDRFRNNNNNKNK